VYSNLPIDIFLMQTDYRVTYDVDPKQTGLNVSSDSSYKPFPEMIALGRKIAAAPERYR
jgi:hypothetical protein